MKHVLIVKDSVTYGAATGGGTVTMDTLNVLVDGTPAVFNGDGTFITAANATSVAAAAAALGTSKTFYMALGRTTEGVIITPHIYREYFEYEKQVYTAPVKKVMYLGADGGGNGSNLPFPTSISVGDEFTVRITNKSVDQYKFNQNQKSFTYVAKAGDTGTTICTAMKALIEAYSDICVTLTINTNDDGFVFTAKDYGVDFAVTGEDEWADATYGTSTAFVPGHGTPAMILDEEKWAAANRGNMNSYSLTNEMWSVASRVDTTKTYTTYACRWRTPHNESHQSMGNPVYKELFIAVPVGLAATVIAYFDNIFAAV